MTFALDKRLEESSYPVLDLDLCTVRLRRDARYPWLYLVPQREGIKELHDLSDDDFKILSSEVRKASAVVATIYQPDKVNIAAFGNMVPQFHVHVQARFKSDAAWPQPIWAVEAPEIAYDEKDLQRTLERLREEFSSCPR